MPTPLEIFNQRFGGQSFGPYNPFQSATQYGNPYTPGTFSMPTPTTPTTPTVPTTPTNPGNPVIGGQPSDPGGDGGRDQFRSGPGGDGGSLRDRLRSHPGFSPGYSDEAAIAGSLMGLLIPGAGMLTSAANGASGIQAANEQADMMGKVIGKNINLSTGDYLNAGTGGMLGDSSYEHGLGGYGQIGAGGFTGMQNMVDPGVMGAARAHAASVLNANNPAGTVGPAPEAGGLLSSPTTPATGGLLSAPQPTPATPGLLTPAKPVTPAKPPAPAKAPVAATSSQVAAARAKALAGLNQLDRDVRGEARAAAEKAFDREMKNLAAASMSGVVTASQLSKATAAAQRAATGGPDKGVGSGLSNSGSRSSAGADSRSAKGGGSGGGKTGDGGGKAKGGGAKAGGGDGGGGGRGNKGGRK